MAGSRRWHVVPQTKAACWLSLLAGALVAAVPIWQLVRNGGAPVLTVVSAVLGVVLIVVSVAGLVAPGLRGR